MQKIIKNKKDKKRQQLYKPMPDQNSGLTTDRTDRDGAQGNVTPYDSRAGGRKRDNDVSDGSKTPPR